MNFSSDRDLLAFEPQLFNDVPFAAQQRLRVSDAVVDGNNVVSPTADFEAAAVEAGSVVLIDRVPHEVIARVNDGTLTVSLPRVNLIDPAIPGQAQGEQELIVRTFALQAALVRDALLKLLGIAAHADEAGDEQALTEDAVLSLSVMARLEAVGTLERVFSSAAAVTGDNRGLLAKATQYRKLFHQDLERATVLIDVNGDGLPEERRRLGLTRLQRV